MTVDPKTSMYLNIIVAVLAAIAGGTISLTDLMSPEWAHRLVAYSTFLVSIFSIANAALHGVSSLKSGPMAGIQVSYKDVKAVLLAIVVSGVTLVIVGQALAETRQHPEGNIVFTHPLGTVDTVTAKKPMKDIFQSILSVALEDLKAASAMAHANSNQVSAPCWDAWIAFIQTAQLGAIDPVTKQPVPLPDIHILYDAERLIDLNNALRPTGPLAIACAPLALQVKMDVLTLLTTAAGGLLVNSIIP